MGNSLLNQIVFEKGVTNPAAILAELHTNVILVLKNDYEAYQLQNGMKISIYAINKQTGDVSFSGAKRPVIFIRDNNLELVKGDSQSIGGELFGKERNFSSHDIKLQPGDLIYLFTDGIVD